MSILVIIIVGAIIGWLGAALTGRSEGILGSIAIGIVGSAIGGFLSTLFSGSNQDYLTFTWAGVLWSLLGAVILSAILNTIQHGARHNA